jgi:hypothetical protein
MTGAAPDDSATPQVSKALRVLKGRRLAHAAKGAAGNVVRGKS